MPVEEGVIAQQCTAVCYAAQCFGLCMLTVRAAAGGQWWALKSESILGMDLLFYQDPPLEYTRAKRSALSACRAIKMMRDYAGEGGLVRGRSLCLVTVVPTASGHLLY